MEKIKKITLNDKIIKMDLDDKELSIPLDKEYVKKNINDALLETNIHLKDSKFYRFGSNVCKIGLTFAIFMYTGCALTDFLLLDLISMLCGGLGAFSLVSLSLFKLFEQKSKVKAYNNQYWLKIRDIALDNIKKSNDRKNVKTKANINVNQNVRTNNFYNNLNEANEIKKIYRKI